MGKIIGVINQKGGSAKSTTCQNIAVLLTQRGSTVLIIDTDEQQSSMKWYAARAEARPSPAVISISQASALQGSVGELSSSYDYVLIDGAAGVSAMTAAAIKVAHSVVIPVQPTLKDFQSTSETAALVAQRQQINDGAPSAVFLMTRTKPRQKITMDFHKVLLGLGLPVLDAQLVERAAFPTADLVAQSVIEFQPKGEAAKDVVAILDELTSNNFL